MVPKQTCGWPPAPRLPPGGLEPPGTPQHPGSEFWDWSPGSLSLAYPVLRGARRGGGGCHCLQHPATWWLPVTGRLRAAWRASGARGPAACRGMLVGRGPRFKSKQRRMMPAVPQPRANGRQGAGVVGVGGAGCPGLKGDIEFGGGRGGGSTRRGGRAHSTLCPAAFPPAAEAALQECSWSRRAPAHGHGPWGWCHGQTCLAGLGVLR